MSVYWDDLTMPGCQSLNRSTNTQGARVLGRLERSRHRIDTLMFDAICTFGADAELTENFFEGIQHVL